MNDKVKRSARIIRLVTGGFVIVVLIAVAVWGIRFFIHLNNFEDTNDAQVQMYINPVTARVGGYIEEVRFEENQEVNKGDTLFIIDKRDYAASVQEAQAAVDNAEAQVNILNSNISTAEKAVAISNAQTEAARADLKRAQLDYDRYKKLYDAESATGQQLEHMQSALEVAKAHYDAALEAARLSGGRVEDVKVSRKALEAEIAKRKAVTLKSDLNVSYTVILAPYKGKMGRRTIQPGQLVQAGQTLGFIVDLQSGKWIVANYKETQLGAMREGQDAVITVDALPGKEFHGKIASFSAATGSLFSTMPPDNATGNFVKIAQRIPVRIRLTDPVTDLQYLYAGMNANVSIKK